MQSYNSESKYPLIFFCGYVVASCYLAANQIEGKTICKLFVQRGLGLAPEARDSSKVPLVVCITRLVAQKGLHLITNAIRHIEALVSLSLSPAKTYELQVKHI